MKRLITFGIMLSCATTTFAANPDLVGHYTCNGMDPTANEAYTGFIDIKKDGDVYSVISQYSTGEKDTGTGIITKSSSDLAIVFKGNAEDGKPGLQLYTISDDGKKLDGAWIYLRTNLIGNETCTKAK